MCLILFAYRVHAEYPLVVAANRDEWFKRPTAPAQFWDDQPDLFAGRDLEQRGTWMGVTRRGRFAALTNYRDPSRNRPGAPSRGHLVSRFLVSREQPEQYVAGLHETAHLYNGYSLLVGDGRSLWYYSNRKEGGRALAPGVYGLSNALLDDAWPKVANGKARLADALRRDANESELLDLLDDTALAPVHALPATGVSPEWEHKLSAMRIVSDGYGTRCSTVLRIGRNGKVTFTEQTYDETGSPAGVVRESFDLVV